MQEQILPSYHAEPAWLVTAASYLTDRVLPDCERIQLPAKEVPGGVFRFGRGPLPAPPQPAGRMAGLRWRGARRAEITPPHDNVFDLRRNQPDNWAHFLNNHLPIVLTICARMQIDPGAVLLILPASIPGYIREAIDMLGLQMLASDDAVTGQGILYDADPWDGIRPARAGWVDTPFMHQALARLDDSATDDLPARVFLSRRNTRAALNEQELADWLGARDFVKIYPEDLSPMDQIRLFRRAEAMVAIHGAGLAPLLYAQPGGRLRHLVEILHAGHMTNVYRVMAHQVGVDWIGVRGRLKPEYIQPAYDFSQIFKTYSLDNFEVDLRALQEAFDMTGLS